MELPKSQFDPSWKAVTTAIAVSATAFYLSTGLTGDWIFAWLAPLPPLLVAFHGTARQTAVTAFTSFLIGSLTLWPYLSSVATPLIATLGSIGPALVFTVAILAARRTVLRSGNWITVFTLPAFWTSYEFLLSKTSVHGTFGSLAYTQIKVLPLIQIASVTGLWGITFLLLLIPSAVAFALRFRTRPRASMALGSTLGLLTLSLGFGWIRLAQPTELPAIRAGLAVTDQTVDSFDAVTPQEALPVVEAYSRRVAKLAKRGARVVVLPEKFVGVTPEYSSQVLNVLSAAARKGNVVLAAGLNRIEGGVKRNSSVVFGNDGAILTDYDKRHFVPGWESGYQPGTGAGVFEVGGQTWGTAICKDMDFPELGLEYSHAGVVVMLVPAWDFVRDAWFHQRMAVLRGVEGGYAALRTAQEGLATISDDRGRVLASRYSGSAREVLVDSEVPPGSGGTFYSRTGDWFPWLCALLLAGLLAASLRRRDLSIVETG